MGDDAARISSRKLDHLEIAVSSGAEGPTGAGWEDVRLVHDCLPDIDISDVNLQTPFLHGQLAAPLWITGMTGGHERATSINARLAAAAQRHGIAMGLGSQRAALTAGSLMETYQSAREAAPHAVLVANIGAPQLVPQGSRNALTLNDLEMVVQSITAQGLAIHLNFLQEAMQPEGDLNARGCLGAIECVIKGLSVPVMVKETGGGINRERAQELARIGVAAIDVGGAGGTSMVRIEGERAHRQGDVRAALASTFDSWGIPTAASILETRNCGAPVIATGGVRSGLDAARALALGAHMVGIGRPFLMAAIEGETALDAAITGFIRELRTALFLTGSIDAEALRARGAVIDGSLRHWAMQRHLM